MNLLIDSLKSYAEDHCGSSGRIFRNEKTTAALYPDHMFLWFCWSKDGLLVPIVAGPGSTTMAKVYLQNLYEQSQAVCIWNGEELLAVDEQSLEAILSYFSAKIDDRASP